MHSDEGNLTCLPLTPGVRILLEDIEKQLASALEILDEPQCSGQEPTSRHVSALNAGRIYVSNLLRRLRAALAADNAALGHDMGF